MTAQFWKLLTRLYDRPVLHFSDAAGIIQCVTARWGYLVHAPDGSMVMAISGEDFAVPSAL
jgi:hypothetical protein